MSRIFSSKKKRALLGIVAALAIASAARKSPRRFRASR